MPDSFLTLVKPKKEAKVLGVAKLSESFSWTNNNRWNEGLPTTFGLRDKFKGKIV